MVNLDYDPIAPECDARYQSGGPEGVAEALDQLTRPGEGWRIVEIGCGTGHWLSGLDKGSWSCGLDISIGMLQRAQTKLGAASLVQADAHRIPLESQSVDLLYCVNALHHFEGPGAVIREAARVLRVSGLSQSSGWILALETIGGTYTIASQVHFRPTGGVTLLLSRSRP